MRTLVLPALLLALAACGPSQPESSVPAPAAAPEASSEEMQARIADLPAPYNEASYEGGRRVFAQCRSCHTIEAGGGNRVGPNLHGVFGREIGTAEGTPIISIIGSRTRRHSCRETAWRSRACATKRNAAM
jgi:cytochrome c